jgi:porphobilinogen synthase
MVQNYPITRLRRLRTSPTMRDLFQEQRLSINDLIYPIFVEEDLDDFAPVESMPGIWRIPERKLDAAIKEIASVGVKAVMTFGVSHHKDATGSDAMKRDGLMVRMVKRAKDAAPDLVVMSDTCFCEYTRAVSRKPHLCPLEVGQAAGSHDGSTNSFHHGIKS